MGIREVLTAPRSPWQNAYAERFIGSMRRECLDHIIIFNESSLRRILKAYFEYYEHSRTHLALEKDAPRSRAVQPFLVRYSHRIAAVRRAASSLRAKSRLTTSSSQALLLLNISGVPTSHGENGVNDLIPGVVLATIASNSLRDQAVSVGDEDSIRLA